MATAINDPPRVAQRSVTASKLSSTPFDCESPVFTIIEEIKHQAEHETLQFHISPPKR